MLELKIGTSWVRGVVGEALTPELIVNFACAFGTWGNGGPVVIGRDPRRSSSMLRAATISGLLSPGCEIVDLGVCPTPLVSFAVRELGAAGGLSITGSHNDTRWNALKFVGPDGTLLNAVKSEELLDVFHAAAFSYAPRDRLPPIEEAPGLVERYLEHLIASLDAEAIRRGKYSIAVDFCNGTCFDLMSRFLAELGCVLLPLNENPSARFAHKPAPTVANMSELARLVSSKGADLGAAVNVDGDRVAFVTESGIPLSEEYTLPLAARNRLARRLGPIVTNLSTSRMIDAVADRHGQPVVRTSVGEGYVVDAGLEESAVLAGEGSGGVGALPTTMTFDALLTLGMVLETLATQGARPSELVAGLPTFAMEKGEVHCSPDQVYRALEAFRSAFAESSLNVLDGVRVDWDDAWLHVRASNTEPLLRVIVEAEGEERASRLFEDAMARGRRAVDRNQDR